MSTDAGTQLPHTGSYYAANVNDVTDFAPLQGEQRTDICIIGAGFTGLSAALSLLERGYKVQIVEANRVGWGASGRNGGQIIGGISGEKTIAKEHGEDADVIFKKLRWAGHDIIRERVRRYGIDCDLKFGYLDVAIKPRHLHEQRADFDSLQQDGFAHEIRLLSAAETQETIGTDAYLGALLNMGNGHLHPLKLCVGEARAAISLGARIYEQSPVINIEKDGKPRVVTQHGAIKADAVIIAGNAYHVLEKKLRGIMFPVSSFIIATEPLPEATVNVINPRDLAVCDPNFVLQYYRLSADKRLLFGARCNYFGDDPQVIERKLRHKLSKLYPQLADAAVDYAWGGKIGVPLKRVPLLGRISPDVYYCQGYSGHGVNVTHLAGKIMADAIAGTIEQFDMFANVKPCTVPGAHLLSTPMVALGMMYYTIRDRL
jgi:gamma-glutamylputrescine oxidase